TSRPRARVAAPLQPCRGCRRRRGGDAMTSHRAAAPLHRIGNLSRSAATAFEILAGSKTPWWWRLDVVNRLILLLVAAGAVFLIAKSGLRRVEGRLSHRSVVATGDRPNAGRSRERIETRHGQLRADLFGAPGTTSTGTARANTSLTELSRTIMLLGVLGGS